MDLTRVQTLPPRTWGDHWRALSIARRIDFLAILVAACNFPLILFGQGAHIMLPTIALLWCLPRMAYLVMSMRVLNRHIGRLRGEIADDLRMLGGTLERLEKAKRDIELESMIDMLMDMRNRAVSDGRPELASSMHMVATALSEVLAENTPPSANTKH